jgi:hypothetical protein
VPRIQEFHADVVLADIDAWLHLGDAWQHLHAITTAHRFIRLLDTFYSYLYLITLAIVVIWVAWRRPDALRARFFTALMLCWILLGTVVAVAASSGGPIFWDRIVGDQRFEPLTAALESARPLWVLVLRERLWTSYLTGVDALASGIAAFPSLHLAMPTLYALYARAAGSSYLAGLFALITVTTMFGSVYLGWHYAIDGYAGIAGAGVIWWLSGRLTGPGARP